MNSRHELWTAPLARRIGRDPRLASLALCGAGIAIACAGMALAQDSDQQIRCMQLQQELASAQGGSGREALPGIEKQIQDANRVFQGTKAAMEDAGCYESFFIFGRGLVRSPKCLSMNDRVEAARRQVEQLQDQRNAIQGGGGNRRRQADLQDALARNGCGRQYQQPVRREGGGGLFNWFGGGSRQEEEEAARPEEPVYRSIDPNGRYRSVCVRTCDGFFFPISYSTYAGRLAQDATMCQSNCAAPAELYVYRNPGQEIDQAISLNGMAYKDLPAAFKYRKTYVKGCSCKEVEYNPTEIEAASQKAEATPAPSKRGARKRPEAPATQAAVPLPAAPAQLDLDITGATANAPAPSVAAPASPPAPSTTPAAPAQPGPQAAVPTQPAQAPQSSVTKSKTPPAPQ
jgi:hypothetical protein